jgi:Holliday junction resolvase RusA-like endonuclease
MLSFFIACVPPTTSHHHKRIVKRGKFASLADKPELVAAKAMLESLLMPFQPSAPVAGPVALTLEFTWPWLKGHSKKVRSQGRIPHTSRPDCSNLTKTLEDRLVALLFLEDDNAVVDLHVRKWWGERPGIAVSICPFNAAVDAALTREGLFSHVPD